MAARDEVRRRERAFYDRKAAGSTPADAARPPDDYDGALIAALGPLEGSAGSSSAAAAAT